VMLAVLATKPICRTDVGIVCRCEKMVLVDVLGWTSWTQQQHDYLTYLFQQLPARGDLHDVPIPCMRNNIHQLPRAACPNAVNARRPHPPAFHDAYLLVIKADPARCYGVIDTYIYRCQSPFSLYEPYPPT
jgi:hypothetical protein